MIKRPNQINHSFPRISSLTSPHAFPFAWGDLQNQESFLHPRWKQPGRTAGCSPLSPSLSRAELCARSQLCLTGRIHRNLFKNIPEKSSGGGGREGSAISHRIPSSGRRLLDIFFFSLAPQQPFLIWVLEPGGKRSLFLRLRTPFSQWVTKANSCIQAFPVHYSWLSIRKA